MIFKSSAPDLNQTKFAQTEPWLEDMASYNEPEKNPQKKSKKYLIFGSILMLLSLLLLIGLAVDRQPQPTPAEESILTPTPTQTVEQTQDTLEDLARQRLEMVKSLDIAEKKLAFPQVRLDFSL